MKKIVVPASISVGAFMLLLTDFIIRVHASNRSTSARDYINSYVHNTIFPFTDNIYTLIGINCLIVLVGAVACIWGMKKAGTLFFTIILVLLGILFILNIAPLM